MSSEPKPVQNNVEGDEVSKRQPWKLFWQLSHLVLATIVLLVGVIEFSVEPSIFDLFGRNVNQRSVVPAAVFPVSEMFDAKPAKIFTSHLIEKNQTIVNKDLEHVIDVPIVALFVIYYLGVLWLKCHGVFALLLTISQISFVLMFVIINAGIAKLILDWRYFYTRAITILLDVIILSFTWTTLVVTLLHIRGWFPFKVKKYRDIPYQKRTRGQKMVVIFWNFIALYLVLGLCFLIWFSRLYMSWACVRHRSEILLMCQFTNMVQCWPCHSEYSDHCESGNITLCISQYNNTDGPIRCISPLYTVHHFTSAFCVFNYNIGPFTIVTVFSYVGGIYFFMRTVLNALVKCLFNIIYIAGHFCLNLYKKTRKKDTVDGEVSKSINEPSKAEGEGEEGTGHQLTNDPRVSLLGPLPHYYAGSKKTSKPKYV